MMHKMSFAATGPLPSALPVAITRNESNQGTPRKRFLAHVKHGLVAIALVALCGLVPPAVAQTSIAKDYSDLIRARTEVVGLNGEDMFGDRIGLYTGSLEFLQTDVSVPGNNGLDVAIRRRLNSGMSGAKLGFGNWELAIPSIHGVFSAKGWKGSSLDPSKRCSAFGEPVTEYGVPGVPPTGQPYMQFTGEEFWHGTFLYFPGGGDEEVLRIAGNVNPPRPTNGYTYNLRTKNGSYLRCIPLGTTAEEAFEVLTPEGITYRFDHMVSRSVIPVFKYLANPPPGYPNQYYLERREYILYPTKATDRFGNTVTYAWSSTNPWQLTRISSSDGRALDITYGTGNWITQVKHGPQTWTYTYDGAPGSLSKVTLPDQTSWTFSGGLGSNGPADKVYCGNAGELPPGVGSRGVTMTHPSGAQGVFTLRPTLHGRSYSRYYCSASHASQIQYSYEYYPAKYYLWSMASKTITGPALPTQSWTYTYSPANGCYSDSDVGGIRCQATSPTTKWVDVMDPAGVTTRHSFGNRWNTDEGQLLSSSNPGQTITRAYQAMGSVGVSDQPRGQGVFAANRHPLKKRAIVRDGVTFTWQVNSFDTDWARPLSVTKYSTISGNPAKTEVTAYHDDLSLWVIGQVKSVTCTAPAACTPSWAPNGIVISRTDYGWKALPWKTYRFGKLQQQLGYDNTSTVASGQLGTIKQVIDGGAHVTLLTDWKRGIPQKITYPTTPDQPTAVFQQAVVNDDGTIASVSDENRFKICYGYDAMGRLNKVTYPSETVTATCDASRWNESLRTFSFVAGVYGLPNHWRLWERTGNGYKLTHYDAMWRPVVEEIYVNGDAANTRSIVVKRYDAAGRLAFQSYPARSLGNWTDTTLKGTKYDYDALNRVTKVTQDSELGVLSTTTEYLTGFKTRVTTPRGKATLTALYQAFDQPTFDFPRGINHPTDANTPASYTEIYRDPFGKPTEIKRRNADSSVMARRLYWYNAAQELCRMIEPETGNTHLGYDAAGNLAWSASGVTTNDPCDPEGDTPAILARRVDRTYDARNRLLALDFVGDFGDQEWSYTPDNLPETITTYHGAGHTVPVVNTYAYNRRRLLTSEHSVQPGWYDWTQGYTYNANGHLSKHTQPGGEVIDYAPNALGQATQAASQFNTYVSGVSYYPNGGIAQFTYGNGIVHTLTQNLRQLPETSRDAYGSTAFLSDTYDYDGNGNVAAITDGATNRSMRGNRTMTYDALDRLTYVDSPMYGAWNATYAYDVLDNLTRLRVGGTKGRDTWYCYDGQQRLVFVRSGSVCTGASASPAVHALTYDVQGNLLTKDEDDFTFSHGNRLRWVAGKESYRYDGHGRRVQAWGAVSGQNILSMYGQDGVLRYQSNFRKQENYNYVYLGGSLVAIRAYDTQAGTNKFVYQHTDSLGSPVLFTGQTRNVFGRREYEPYGEVILPESPLDGPGYTGHVYDSETGLNYMQQRYYDPAIGRFLSVDPVTAHASPGANFNRYWYANNNPYGFVDPDGRQPRCGPTTDEALKRSDGCDPPVDSNETTKQGANQWMQPASWDENVSGPLQRQNGSILNDSMAAGENAAQHWAELHVKTDNPLYALLGGLASLWTHDTAPKTSLVLSLGSAAGAWSARPFWQYYPAGNSTYSSTWMTRGRGWNPPYAAGAPARNALALPPWNPATAVRPVYPSGFVRGPRAVQPQPQWGHINPTGVEYRVVPFGP